MSSDAIDEIQSKKRREKGLEAWAEMLQRLQQRGPAQGVQEDAPTGGSSRLPTKDMLVLSDPKLAENRRQKLHAIKTANEAAQAEARRLQDRLEVSQARKSEASRPAEKPAAAPPPAPKPVAPVQPGQQAAVPPGSDEPAAVTPSRENTEVASSQVRAQETSPTAVEERVELAMQANVQPASTDGFSSVSEPEPPASLSAAEEAAMLAALRSGVGANPELAAKDYVLAADLPGVKETLQGGIYEDFRVAL